MTIEEINEIFADNTSGSITAEDLRSFAVSTKSESTQTNVRIDELTEVVDKKSNTESELKRVEDPENPEFFSWRLKEYSDQYPESVKNSNDNVNLGFNISTAGILKDNDYPAVNGSLNNVFGFANTVSGLANQVNGVCNIMLPKIEYNDDNELQSIKNNFLISNHLQGYGNTITGGINTLMSPYRQNDDNKIDLGSFHREYFELLEVGQYIYISYIYLDNSKVKNDFMLHAGFINSGFTRVKIIDKDDRYIYLEGPWIPEDINYDYDRISSITRDEDIRQLFGYANIIGNCNNIENYLNIDDNNVYGPSIIGNDLIGSGTNDNKYVTYLGRFNKLFKFTSDNAPTLIVGIGTDARLRKNGFIVENSGRILAPECIVDQPKCLTSKEYVDDLHDINHSYIVQAYRKFNRTSLRSKQKLFDDVQEGDTEFIFELDNDFYVNGQAEIPGHFSLRVYKNRMIQLKDIDYTINDPDDDSDENKDLKVTFKTGCKDNDEIYIELDYVYHEIMEL